MELPALRFYLDWNGRSCADLLPTFYTYRKVGNQVWRQIYESREKIYCPKKRGCTRFSDCLVCTLLFLWKRVVSRQRSQTSLQCNYKVTTLHRSFSGSYLHQQPTVLL